MRFHLEINSDNDALTGDGARDELARILREAAKHLALGLRDDAPCRDVNGNRVGGWVLTPDED